MVTAQSSLSDAESSAKRRVAQSVGAHLVILQAMIARMKLERETLPADAIAEHVLLDLRIRNVERDIRLLRQKLMERN